VANRGILELGQRPRPLVVAGVVVLLLAGLVAWWRSSSPQPLPRSDRTVHATTKVGSAVYVGMFTAGDPFTRTLHVSGVKVHATSNSAVTLTPLLCRGGSFVQTTDPEVYCAELVDPEGQTFSAGDGIVLRVVSDQPGVVVVDRVRLAFREGLRWATSPVGTGAVVQVLPS
jgi:hypothetical protein